MRRRTGSIRPHGNGFQIRWTDSDGLRQQATFPTIEAATRELAQKLADVTKGLPATAGPSVIKFEELARDVEDDYAVNRYCSIDDLKARFKKHIIPVFGHRKAAQITTAALNAYILRRQAEGAATGTINRELEAIRHAFRLAIQGRKLYVMPHVPHMREDNVRSGFFTRDEVERLCCHLRKPLDSLVRLAFLTGWRREEIVSLKWSNVDFTAGEIRLDPGTTKNREGRVFPMTAELRTLLESLTPTGTVHTGTTRRHVVPSRGVSAFGATHVFTNNGRPIGDFRKRWLRACFKAGLPCVVNTEGKPLKAIRIFHDLRRSTAREMIRQGIPERVVMNLCGWKTRSVLDRYNVVSEADMRNAAEVLNRASKRASDKS